MNDKENEILFKAKEALEEFKAEDDPEPFQEIIEKIPESYWSDKEFYTPMLQMYVDYFDTPFNEYEIGDYIPEAFWEDKTRALVGIRFIFHEGCRCDAWNVVPRKALQNREVAYELAERVPSQALSCAVPDSIRKEKDFVFLVLDGMEAEIRNSYDNYPALPIDSGECFELFLKDIDPIFKTDKEFIIRLLADYSYFEDHYGLLYDWIEPKLWEDKPFVIEVLKIVFDDKRVLGRLSDEMLNDDDIKELIE